MFARVLPSRARSCMARKFGIAIAARMPMITTTIISSIRVKPRSRVIDHLLTARPTCEARVGVVPPSLATTPRLLTAGEDETDLAALPTAGHLILDRRGVEV